MKEHECVEIISRDRGGPYAEGAKLGAPGAQQVYRELKEMGYTGSDQPIQRYFVQFRKAKDFRKFKQVDPAQETPVQAPPRRPPTASQVAHWITFKEDQRLEWQKQYLSHLCEADQEIREANELIQEFTTMLRERKGECFDAWLEKVEQQGISELRGFALSLKKDYEAVKAGLTLPWSQGQVEGQCATPEAPQAPRVWSGKLPDAAQSGAAMQLEGPLKEGSPLNHQLCVRARML